MLAHENSVGNLVRNSAFAGIYKDCCWRGDPLGDPSDFADHYFEGEVAPGLINPDAGLLPAALPLVR